MITVARVDEKGLQVLTHKAIDDGPGRPAQKTDGRESRHDPIDVASYLPQLGS